jgi:hypothetical protein
MKQMNLKKLIGVLALLALVTVGGLFARALFVQRDFTGMVRIEVCKPDANGKWIIVDSIDAPTSFSMNVVDLASEKEVTSKTVWAGKSAKGRKVSVRLLRAGKAAVDLKSGKIVLSQMPFEVTVDGQKEAMTYTLTTESAEGANGPINGKRAVINGNTATVALVGSTKIRTNKFGLPGQATVAGVSKAEDFQVVIKANGQVTAR